MDNHKGKKGKSILYLSIDAVDQKEAQKACDYYIELAAILLVDKENQNILFQRNCSIKSLYKELLGTFKQSYQFPQSIHITTLFMSKKPNINSHFYKNFEEGIKCTIKINAIAICLTKIITGICMSDDYPVPIENKYPHVTMKLGTCKPKESNDLLEAIFSTNVNLYEELKAETFEPYVRELEVTFSGSKEKVYVVKLAQYLQMEAITKYC